MDAPKNQSNTQDIYGRLPRVKPVLRLFRLVRAERVCLPAFESSWIRFGATRNGLLIYNQFLGGTLSRSGPT